MDTAPNGTTTKKEPKLLWTHSHSESTRMWDFLQLMNKERGLELKTYHDLHRWSVENVSEFWGRAWQYLGIRASQPYTQVRRDLLKLFLCYESGEGEKLTVAGS